MESKIATICSIRRKPENEKSMEYALFSKGYNRHPGTVVPIPPYKESTGRYRTGLDENAVYIKDMSEEEAIIEKARVRGWRLELQKALGFPDPENLDETHALGPFSPYYTRMMDNSMYGSGKVCPLARLSGNTTTFNLEDPIQKLQYAYLRVNPRVSPSWSHFNDGKLKNSTYVQFYVNDPEVENVIAYDDNKKLSDSIVKLSSLRPADKIRVARLLGLPVIDTTPEQTVFNLLFAFINQKSVSDGVHKGKNAAKLFLSVADMKPDNLLLKDKLLQAMTYSIVRRLKSGYFKGEQMIGKNEDDALAFLSSDKGSEWLATIDEELKLKKSATDPIQ